MTEDELVEWPYRLSGHECGQTLGDSEGQGSLVCCSPWSPKELDKTQRLNSNNNLIAGAPSSLCVQCIAWLTANTPGMLADLISFDLSPCKQVQEEKQKRESKDDDYKGSSDVILT